MISFFILLLLTLTAQTIPLNRDIQNLQAGTFAFTNTVNSQSQLYMWQFVKTFDTVPQLAYAIHSFSLTNASLIGSFNLFTQVITEIGAIVSWQRQIARWTSLTINYLATNRKDILLGYNQLSFKSNNSQDFDVNLKTNISIFSTSVVRVYLSGCDAQAVFDCGIAGKKLTQNVLTVSAYLPTGVTTGNLSFSFIIFSPSSANFSSYGGMLDKNAFKGSLSLDIRRVVYRTKDILYGFSMLNFSLFASQSVNLSIDNDMVLSLSSDNLIDKIRLIYIAIGMTSKELCNTTAYGFEFNEECLASCPNNTYIMSYSNGGLSCNTCSPKLNLVLAQKGCACAEGFTKVNETCISSNDSSINSKQSTGGSGIQNFLDLFKQLQRNLNSKLNSSSSNSSGTGSSASSTSSTNSSTTVSSASSFNSGSITTFSSSSNSNSQSKEAQNASSNTSKITGSTQNGSKNSSNGSSADNFSTTLISTKNVSSSTVDASATSSSSSSSSITANNSSNSSPPVNTNTTVINSVNNSVNDTMTNTSITSTINDTNKINDKANDTNTNSASINNSSQKNNDSTSAPQSYNNSQTTNNQTNSNKDQQAQQIAVVYQTQRRSVKTQPTTYQEQPLISTSISNFTNSSLCTANAYYMDGRCFCMPGFRNSSGKCTIGAENEVQQMVIDLTQKKKVCSLKPQQAQKPQIVQQGHQSCNNESQSQRSRKNHGNRSNYSKDEHGESQDDENHQNHYPNRYSRRREFENSHKLGCNSSQFEQYPVQNTCNQNDQRCDQSDKNNDDYRNVSDKLQCPKGYVSYGHKCVKCPSPATFDYIQGKCIYFCGQFATFNQSTQKCECQIGYGKGKDGVCGYCNDGTFLLNGFCVRCSDGKVYDSASNSCKCGPGTFLTANGCVSRCGQFQNYNQITDSCVCQAGFGRVQGKCQLCPVNQRPDSNGLCSACPANQQLVKGKCICASGYVLSDNACLPCEQTQRYMINGICSFCAIGFNYINGGCVLSPTINSVAGKKIGIDNAIAMDKPSICGNGMIEGLEQCDDRNSKNGDGCDSQCRIQAGWTCCRMPSQCVKSSINKVTSDTSAPPSNSRAGRNPQNNSNQQQKNSSEASSSSTSANASSSSLKTNSSSNSTISTNITTNKSTQGSLFLQGSPSGNSNQIYLTLNTGLPFEFADQATMQSFLKSKFQGCKPPTFYFTQRSKTQRNLFDCLLIFPSGVPNGKFSATFWYSYNGSSAEIPVAIDPLTMSSVMNSRSNSRQQARG